jgi:hypothetical protein
VNDAGLIDREALKALGLRAVAQPAPGSLHLIVGPAAGHLGEALRALTA